MPVSMITVAMILFMAAYQLLKRLLLPDITLWQSNLITIVFVSTVAAVLGFIMLRRLQRKDAEIESILQDQINFMQTLIDSIPAPLFYKDENLIYQGCNQAFQAFLGMTREEIEGKTVYDIAPPDLADTYQEKDLSLIRNPGQQSYEFSVKHADGSLRDVVFSKATFLKSDGSVGGVIGVITDITEQKRLIKRYEDALEHVSKLEYIVNRSPAIAFIWRAEEEWPVEYVSESIRHFGYAPEDFYERRINFLDIVHPDDLARVAEEVRQYSEEGRVEFTQEYRIIDCSGETRWIDDRTWVQRGSGGAVSHYQGIVVDITERKRAEEALHKSEELYRLLADNITDVIWVSDMNLNLTYLSPSSPRMFGFTVEENLPLSIDRRLTPASVEIAIETFGKELPRYQSGAKKPSESTTLELEFYHKDGTTIWTESTITPLLDKGGNITGLVGVARDISSRKLLQDALKVSEEKYRTLVEDISDIIYSLDPEGIFTYISPVVRQLGYTPEEVIGKPATDFVFQEDLPKVFEYLKAVAKGGEMRPTEYRAITKSGDIRWLRAYGKFSYEEGIPRHSHGVLTDITKNKQAAEALQKSEERLELVLRGADLGLWDWNIRTDEVFFNERWAEMIGYSPEEVDPHLRSWTKLVHPDDLQTVNEKLYTHIKGQTPFFEAEYRARTKSGEWIWVLDRGMVVERGKEGEVLRATGTHLDITERKKADELIQNSLSEKEVLLKEIHHRVKNNFAVISSLLSLQKGTVTDESSARILDDMQTRIRAMSLIHEKLYQSDDLSLIDFSVYIKTIAAELQKMYVHRLGITIRTDLEAVQLSIGQAIPCGLILNEILSNSFKHAFPGEREGFVLISLHQSRGEITLHIGDNGVGMPDEVDFGRTESLGLRLVHLLTTKQLDGTIVLGRRNGTAFDIRFPKR